jgi:hypothetical protein
MKPARVIVVQEPLAMRNGRPAPRFDLTPAKKFGDVEFLLDWSETTDLRGKEAELIQKLRQRLDGFSDRDYILFSGDWAAMALAVTLALEINDGRAKCLQWDRDTREYRILQLDLHQPPPTLINGR